MGPTLSHFTLIVLPIILLHANEITKDCIQFLIKYINIIKKIINYLEVV